MKRNMLSVLILALLIINIVLTGVMMFSVVNTNKKTAELVNNVASVLNLELGEADQQAAVSVADLVIYNISQMTIFMKSTDGADHYVNFNISFMMNSKDKDYDKYGSTIAEKENLLKSIVNDVVGSYTIDEFKADFDGIEDEILQAIQTRFDSKFIYEVAISEEKYQ